MMSHPGDGITLWIVRKGLNRIKKLKRTIRFVEPVHVPHLGTWEKPPYKLWGEMVLQDFNDFTVSLFNLPPEEVNKKGVLLTYVEPNSLASRRSMHVNARRWYSFSSWGGGGGHWIIIETINGKPVNNLQQAVQALDAAEKTWKEKSHSADYDPKRKIFYRERYVLVGFRTPSVRDKIIHLEQAFPIDEAIESNKGMEQVKKLKTDSGKPDSKPGEK